MNPTDRGAENVVGSAAVGTAIGAAAGALAGCASPTVITLNDGREIQAVDTPKAPDITWPDKPE